MLSAVCDCGRKKRALVRDRAKKKEKNTIFGKVLVRIRAKIAKETFFVGLCFEKGQ